MSDLLLNAARRFGVPTDVSAGPGGHPASASGRAGRDIRMMWLRMCSTT